MAFDLQNDIFTKTFTGGDGIDYTIMLICGHNLDITSANTVEFPDNVIFPTAEGEVGYEDDLPIGLPMARTLKLEIDLVNLKDGDWADVSQAIVRGRSTSVRSVNSVDMYIPNIWIITSSLQGFYSCQVPSDQSIEIESGVAKYTIDLIGIEKPVLERLSIDMLDLENLTPTWTITATASPAPSNDVVNVCYNIGGSDKRFYNEEPIDGKKFYSMSAFFGRIESKAQNILDAFLRTATETVTITTTDIDSVWTFYDQDTSTNHNRGSSLPFDDLLIFGYLYGTGGDNKGGFFDPADNGLYNYNNAWSFLRQFCDSMFLKATFGTDDPLLINFYPVLDTISTSGALADVDPKEYKLKPTDKYISEATAFTVGGGTGDIVNAKAVSNYGSIDGASNDAEIMFNTLTLEFIDGMQAAFDDGGTEYVRVSGEMSKKGHPSGRSLYYKHATGVNGRDFFKVHDDCDLYMGDSFAALSGDSTAYNALPYAIPASDDAWLQNIKTYSATLNNLINRQNYYGIGYNRCNAAKFIFSNERQGTFTAKLSAQISNSDFIYLDALGETYTVNLSTVSGVASLGVFSGSLILTNIKYNFIEGTADCTFFMRGDTGV